MCKVFLIISFSIFLSIYISMYILSIYTYLSIYHIYLSIYHIYYLPGLLADDCVLGYGCVDGVPGPDPWPDLPGLSWQMAGGAILLLKKNINRKNTKKYKSPKNTLLRNLGKTGCYFPRIFLNLKLVVYWSTSLKNSIISKKLTSQSILQNCLSEKAPVPKRVFYY